MGHITSGTLTAATNSTASQVSLHGGSKHIAFWGSDKTYGWFEWTSAGSTGVDTAGPVLSSGAAGHWQHFEFGHKAGPKYLYQVGTQTSGFFVMESY